MTLSDSDGGRRTMTSHAAIAKVRVRDTMCQCAIDGEIILSKTLMATGAMHAYTCT